MNFTVIHKLYQLTPYAGKQLIRCRLWGELLQKIAFIDLFVVN